MPKRQKVASAILKEKDPQRGDAPVAHDSVIFVVDTLYEDAKKETEGLPDGVIARIRGIDITEYEYGRALAIELPKMDVLRAVRGLILEEETALLIGDRNPPTADEIVEMRRQILERLRVDPRRHEPFAGVAEDDEAAIIERHRPEEAGFRVADRVETFLLQVVAKDVRHPGVISAAIEVTIVR